MVRSSYSSGRNEEATKDCENKPQSFSSQGDGPNDKDIMVCHPYSAVGVMNLSTLLVDNIKSHAYFKACAQLTTFEQVVDKIYYDVYSSTPWKPGTLKNHGSRSAISGLRGIGGAGEPSTCYMLLFKLFTLRLTKQQVRALITHQDSPFIRVIGFLYIRHLCEPDLLWGWLGRYVDDREKFSEFGNDRVTTIGAFVRRICMEPDYHGTKLPRLPVPVARDISTQIVNLGFDNHTQASYSNDRNNSSVRHGRSYELSKSRNWESRRPTRGLSYDDDRHYARNLGGRGSRYHLGEDSGQGYRNHSNDPLLNDDPYDTALLKRPRMESSIKTGITPDAQTERAPEAARNETASEKLARLRAKQAQSIYVGTVGGDYLASSRSGDKGSGKIIY